MFITNFGQVTYIQAVFFLYDFIFILLQCKYHYLYFRALYKSAIVCARSKDVYVESWILGTGLCHWIQGQYSFNTILLCFSFTRTLSDNWMRCYYFHITYVLVMALQRNRTNGMYIYVYISICVYVWLLCPYTRERERKAEKEGWRGW